ncbi:MAG: NAD(P)-dependent oxidoreductase [Caldilineaceae bacterium]|nr:NAD(P)-dependent oxidoreductase [Caldilineaceae bacterium]
MHLLITSATTPLAQTIATTLQGEHTLRLTDRTPWPGAATFALSPLGPDLATNLLVQGMDAIVHVAEPLPTDSDLQQIDYLTRCTYNLCLAAAAEGVKRLIYLSTLELMTAYDPAYLVNERWKPLPPPHAPVLAKHLGEFTCREFAREHQLAVVVLRVGKVVRAEEVAGQPVDPLWVDGRDVAQAVALALTASLPRWSLFHISAVSPQARFPSVAAEHTLHYTPHYNFAGDLS